jgi:hypothetical protein
VPSEPGGVGQQRGKSLHPAVDRDVVDLDAAFGEEFLDIAVGQGRSAGTSGPPRRSPRPENGTRRKPIGAATRSETGQHASPVKPALILRSANAEPVDVFLQSAECAAVWLRQSGLGSYQVTMCPDRVSIALTVGKAVEEVDAKTRKPSPPTSWDTD